MGLYVWTHRIEVLLYTIFGLWGFAIHKKRGVCEQTPRLYAVTDARRTYYFEQDIKRRPISLLGNAQASAGIACDGSCHIKAIRNLRGEYQKQSGPRGDGNIQPGGNTAADIANGN